MARKIAAFALLYIAMLALATTAMLATSAIADSAVRRNADRARLQICLADNGLRYMSNGMKFPALMQDRITDYIMVSAACPPDTFAELTLAERAMLCPAVSHRSECASAAEARRSADTFYGFEPALYGRYWHGYLVWLRPLLLVTDARGVYTIVAVTLYALLAALCLLMWRRRLWRGATALLASLVLCAWWVVPGCIALSISWGIAFAASIVMLAVPRLTSPPLSGALTFFAIGSLTSFSELMLTPLVTLTLPCIVVGLSQERWRSCRGVAVLAACWLAGYAGMWAGKWLAAWALTGHNFAAEAWHSIMMRTMGTGSEGGAKHILSRFGALIAAHPWATAAAAAAVIIIAIVATRRARRAGSAWLLAVAGTQIAWFALTAEHALVHFPYTYRALAPVVMAIILTFLSPQAAPSERGGRR